MTKHYDDLTIEEVMADPMIRKVMRADKVEPRRLETLLRKLASRSGAVYGVPPAAILKDARRPASCGSPCSW